MNEILRTADGGLVNVCLRQRNPSWRLAPCEHSVDGGRRHEFVIQHRAPKGDRLIVLTAHHRDALLPFMERFAEKLQGRSR